MEVKEGLSSEELKDQANEIYGACLKSWLLYAASLDVGPRRIQAFEIYNNLHDSTRVPLTE